MDEPWRDVTDDALVERLIWEMQKGVAVALTGTAEPIGEVQLPMPEAATALLNLLASVLEPACGTPQRGRKVAEAAGRELLVLIRGVRELKGRQSDAKVH